MIYEYIILFIFILGKEEMYICSSLLTFDIY